jgi:hypothetical protein
MTARKAKAKAKAGATTNTGVLRFAQDDGVKQQQQQRNGKSDRNAKYVYKLV